MFTLEQVKEAFWAMFHRSGEQWFSYFGEEEPDLCTNEAWNNFVEALYKAKQS